MIRTLNFAFIAITGFVCLGLYRIAEEARVAQVDLRETHAAIVQEQDALAVLGAEWARVTQPARISALSQKHLDLSDLPVMEFSSLTQLPQKALPLAPEIELRHRQGDRARGKAGEAAAPCGRARRTDLCGREHRHMSIST